MVVLSQPVAHVNFPTINSCNTHFTHIPVVDLSNPNAKAHIVNACQEFGFFKVINHGVPMEAVTKLEAQARSFFKLPQNYKNKAAPFGYGNKNIGRKGDTGWVEYLLFGTNTELISQNSLTILPNDFWLMVDKYLSAIKKMACGILELIADELSLQPKNVWSRLLSDEKSDSFFRINHYPASDRNELGFGEHTDPQIISVIRSNNASGLEIALKDGTWVQVPADPNSFFITVDDCLQVMTNGRFKSVKHRVITESMKERISMIYFGGPPLTEKIAPSTSLMQEEESLYKEFTWGEYKKAAFNTNLAFNRISFFEKCHS
ncbi:Gibberellin 2-beta-dioxygenase 1 [Heracleum sosnowskyi]|uniref:gibberellin 2beta-dioxygenase n=1 Tax=Heracleum sosnowskyi TaxID=360622 RepID=A0AAD8MM69_9APIA|nr:Gibberellin 2-beta-dioxygenase 1 [Heracleum sosnowskyi]